MKKKLFTFLLIVIAVVAFDCAALAARKTEFPITIREGGYYSDAVQINSFEVDSVEKVPGVYENRIYYEMDYTDITGYATIMMQCYDAQGMPLKAVEINRYSTYVDVPDVTATFELTTNQPAASSESYFYCNYMNVYSYDGRVMAICDLQLPVYQTVGWYAGETMYSLDDRTIEVSPFLVDAYKKVGWYTLEGYFYEGLIKQWYNENKAAADYASNIEIVNDWLWLFTGTEYESSMYAIRTEAMDALRVQSGKPLYATGYLIDKESDYYPVLEIDFCNVSYSPIIAFKMQFDCYDVFGNYLEDDYTSYYADDIYLLPGSIETYSWDLDGVGDDVYKISNFKITTVVFEDDTVLNF